jgi:hypothetical protein
MHMWSLVHGHHMPCAFPAADCSAASRNLGTADGQKMIHKIVYKIMGSVGFVFI